LPFGLGFVELRSTQHGTHPKIRFTTRNKLLTAKWLIENDIDKYIEDITNTKDLA
jgi:hypothetical protein